MPATEEVPPEPEAEEQPAQPAAAAAAAEMPVGAADESTAEAAGNEVTGDAGEGAAIALQARQRGRARQRVGGIRAEVYGRRSSSRGGGGGGGGGGPAAEPEPTEEQRQLAAEFEEEQAPRTRQKQAATACSARPRSAVAAQQQASCALDETGGDGEGAEARAEGASRGRRPRWRRWRCGGGSLPLLDWSDAPLRATRCSQRLSAALSARETALARARCGCTTTSWAKRARCAPGALSAASLPVVRLMLASNGIGDDGLLQLLGRWVAAPTAPTAARAAGWGSRALWASASTVFTTARSIRS